MKTCCLLLLAALFAGCSSVNSAKSGSPAAVAEGPSSSESSQYHARTISEYSEGESKFLNMATNGDVN